MLAFSLALLMSASSLPASAPTELEDADNVARIDFLQQRLDQGTRNANIWFWTWEGLYSATTLAQGVIALAVNDRETRVNVLVGGTSSLIGVVALFIPPFVAAFAAGQVRKLPETTRDERAKKRLAAEEIMRDTADNAAFGRSWLMHAGGAAISLAGGLVVWLAFHYFIDGLINTLSAMAVVEVQIFTQPIRSVRDWQDYQARFATSPPSGQSGKLDMHFGMFPGGLSLYGSF